MQVNQVLVKDIAYDWAQKNTNPWFRGGKKTSQIGIQEWMWLLNELEEHEGIGREEKRCSRNQEMWRPVHAKVPTGISLGNS